MQYPSHLLKLSSLLQRFPGVGAKSAERFAFNLLEWPEDQQKQLAEAILSMKSEIQFCSDCGCLQNKGSCFFCNDPAREKRFLCLVAHAKDVFSFESTGSYRGLYHVLGGLISSLDDQDNIDIAKLLERIEKNQVEEVIIALDSTVEGDATSLYLKKILSEREIKTSRIAFGIPVGSALEFIDETTLSQALSARRFF